MPFPSLCALFVLIPLLASLEHLRYDTGVSEVF
jgi:hypothetical protein